MAKGLVKVWPIDLSQRWKRDRINNLNDYSVKRQNLDDISRAEFSSLFFFFSFSFSLKRVDREERKGEKGR
jgi:hypothetical protein